MEGRQAVLLGAQYYKKLISRFYVNSVQCNTVFVLRILAKLLTLYYCLQQREKYEQAVRALSDDTPRYMEDMEIVFTKCQDFEKKRLEFFKDIFYLIHGHLDLPNNVQ